MKSYAFKNANGRIVGAFFGSEADLALNIPADTEAVEGHFDAATTYFDGSGANVPFPDPPGDWAVWDWTAHAWTDPRDAAWYTAQTEAQIAALRAQRDALLRACDWVTCADVPMDAAKKAEWVTYRQALRDMPATTTDPENPIWPTPPA